MAAPPSVLDRMNNFAEWRNLLATFKRIENGAVHGQKWSNLNDKGVIATLHAAFAVRVL